MLVDDSPFLSDRYPISLLFFHGQSALVAGCTAQHGVDMDDVRKVEGAGASEVVKRLVEEHSIDEQRLPAYLPERS